MEIDDSFLEEVAGYDARLAAMVAHKQDPSIPFRDNLVRFHSLPQANTLSHTKLGEEYAKRVAESEGDDPHIISRLKGSLILHGSILFRGRDAKEVLGEMRASLEGIGRCSDFFGGVVSEFERLESYDYTGIVNPGFGGFNGSAASVTMPSMLQRIAVDRAIGMRNSGLYLPMGSGKTAIAVLAMERLFKEGDTGKGLVVCTTSAYDEFLKGLDGEDGTRYIRRKPRVYFFGSGDGFNIKRFRESDYAVIDFDRLRSAAYGDKICAQVLLEEPWTKIAIDEPHVMRSSSSRRASYVKGLIDLAEGYGRYSFMLTGTNSKDTFDSFANQIKMLDSGLGERLESEEVAQEELLGLADRKALIVTDGMAGVKPLEPRIVMFDMPPEARGVYDSLVKKYGKCFHPIGKLLIDLGSYGAGLERVDNPKLRYIVEKAREWSGAGDKFLIFLLYTRGFMTPDANGRCFGEEIKGLLGDRGDGLELYSPAGQDSMSRHRLCDRYRNGDGVDGMMLPSMSCGIALNLQNARHMILPSPIEDPVNASQIQARINREGQEGDPDLTVLVYRGTVEEEKLKRLQFRATRAKLLRYFVLPTDIKPNAVPSRDGTSFMRGTYIDDEPPADHVTCDAGTDVSYGYVVQIDGEDDATMRTEKGLSEYIDNLVGSGISKDRIGIYRRVKYSPDIKDGGNGN